MGILVAVVIAAAAAFGVKDGMFKKGYDTTKKDTLAFERNALELELARVQSKQERKVVELNGATPEALKYQARLDSKKSKLESRIAELQTREEQLETHN